MASMQEQILNHMKMGFSISPAVAATDYSCYCLAAVIHKIKDKVKVYDRYIPGTNSKEYALTPFEK